MAKSKPCSTSFADAPASRTGATTLDHVEEEAGPGDFIYVPPYVPHPGDERARADEPVEAVVVRSGQEPIVVNLDIASAEPAPPAGGDPFHSNGGGK